MDHRYFSLFDMGVVGVPAIVFGIWQLVSINREIARDRAKRPPDSPDPHITK